MAFSPDEILEYFSHQARRPLSSREVAEKFARRAGRRDLQRALKSLVREGALVRLKGGRYSLPQQVNLVIGRVSAHRDGFGFLEPEKGGTSIFLPARTMRQVMDGDLVSARVEKQGPGKKAEGRVIKVLERARETVVGRYYSSRRFGYLVPENRRLTHEIMIPPDQSAGAQPGQIAVARIDAYPTAGRNPEGTIVEVLGAPDDPVVEILSIAHQFGLPHQFPPPVLAAARKIPQQVLPEDRLGRVDLTHIPLVTIDGETAKDFDDAVFAEREEGDGFRLWVAIADVAHYVVKGSPIDREAYARGTSVYFPGQCLPMLPEELSNVICSLNPGVERLALTAELTIDDLGRPVSSRFYPAVIRSRARLTYRQVQSALDGQGGSLPNGMGCGLEVLRELAGLLLTRRSERGSIDFDLPEAEVVLDLQGQTEDVVRSERTFAHRIIEEMMLAANEAVAKFLTGRGAAFLYRIHEPPDSERISEFEDFLGHLGFARPAFSGKIKPRQVQEWLRQVEGTAVEGVVNQVLLRCLKQARYSPESRGHFGLAADCYCHFTSPIRRYPDLTVHRVLRKAVAGEKVSLEVEAHQELTEIGKHTSWRERQALEAERQIIALKKCQFMEKHLGKEFSGVISSIQPFGFFVELAEFPVEGLIRLSSLADDFYDFQPERWQLIGRHTGRKFELGQTVRVTVKKVDAQQREIDFSLVGSLNRETRERQRGFGRARRAGNR